MKVLMTGGGTAGHVTPNIALLQELIKDGHSISYIGTENGMEKKLILNENVDYYSIEAGKLRRYISKENLSDVLKIFKGFRTSLKHIETIKPEVVFSKGGFVSTPVVWAAWIKRIPVIIHESDLTPGLANKLSMPFAKKICYSFPKTSEYLKEKKSVFTGIPIRNTLFNGDRAKGLNLCGFTDSKPVILIIGGSLGSSSINKLVRESLSLLSPKYQVCHLCGENSIDLSLNDINGYKQFEYVNEELKDLMAMADIVVSRAGATTLFELLNLAKPNILIPLPKSSSRGDQILNANFFNKEGYSEVLEEDGLTKEIFVRKIKRVLDTKHIFINKMENSSIKDSVRLVSEIIINEGNKKLKK